MLKLSSLDQHARFADLSLVRVCRNIVSKRIRKKQIRRNAIFFFEIFLLFVICARINVASGLLTFPTSRHLNEQRARRERIFFYLFFCVRLFFWFLIGRSSSCVRRSLTDSLETRRWRWIEQSPSRVIQGFLFFWFFVSNIFLLLGGIPKHVPCVVRECNQMLFGQSESCFVYPVISLRPPVNIMRLSLSLSIRKWNEEKTYTTDLSLLSIIYLRDCVSAWPSSRSPNESLDFTSVSGIMVSIVAFQIRSKQQTRVRFPANAQFFFLLLYRKFAFDITGESFQSLKFTKLYFLKLISKL